MQLEYIMIETWTKKGSIKVGYIHKVVWCGDFNAHSAVWSNYKDENGNVTEELMEN